MKTSSLSITLGFLFSAFVHGGALIAVIRWSHAPPPLPPTIKVRLAELPKGLGGSLDPGEAPEPTPSGPVVKDPTAPDTSIPKSTPHHGSPGLGGTGPVGLGGQGGGVFMDDETFRYAWYQARLEAMLKAAWRPPLAPKGTAATVHFTVGRKGDLQDVKLVGSSRDGAFDASVLAAIRSSSPFPPLPASFEKEKVGVLYVFRLEQ